MIVLNLLNQMHEAKLNNSLDPEMFSKVVDYTNNLFFRKIVSGRVTDDKKENYLANSPKSDIGFAYNHHRLEEVNEKLINNLNKLQSYVVGNVNDMSNGIGRTR